MTLQILPHHLKSFSLWLQKRQYQSNTIRNYLQDLKIFFAFSQSKISVDLIESYITYLSDKNNSKRYLASLSTFCRFLLNQHITDSNLFKQANKSVGKGLHDSSSELEDILMQYKEQLEKENKSSHTIKNYINDIRQYLDWIKLNGISN